MLIDPTGYSIKLHLGQKEKEITDDKPPYKSLLLYKLTHTTLDLVVC